MSYTGDNKIYINGRFLTQNITGVQRYAYELAKKLLEIRADLAFIVPANSTINTAYNISNWTIISTGRYTGHIWEQIELPRFLKIYGSPLLINFCSTAPLYYKNQVVTIHDLAFKHGKWHSFPFRAFYNFLLPRIAKTSKKIVTVSEFSKKDIVSSYGISNLKISVIYGAVFIHNQSDPAPRQSNANATYGSDDGNYILSVGSIDPRKNIKSTIKAFLNIKEYDSYNLIFIGGYNKSFNKDKELDLLIESHKNKIKFLGYVTDNELSTIYSNAKLFIYPSLFEGFGLPPLEAMHYGVPVIVSNVTSLPEVCGNAALYCDPTSTENITAAINTLLADPERMNDMKQKGNEQVKKFSFGASAKKMAELIDTIT